MDMRHISDRYYETLFLHAAEQLTNLLPERGEAAHGEACQALTDTWQAELAPNGWLAAAGARLGVDATACQGIER